MADNAYMLRLVIFTQTQETVFVCVSHFSPTMGALFKQRLLCHYFDKISLHHNRGKNTCIDKFSPTDDRSILNFSSNFLFRWLGGKNTRREPLLVAANMELREGGAIPSKDLTVLSGKHSWHTRQEEGALLFTISAKKFCHRLICAQTQCGTAKKTEYEWILY